MKTRRQFFGLLSGLAGALSIRAADSPKGALIVRSTRPEDLEAPLEAFDQWITPVEQFFVRSHMSRPTVDAASWRLAVEGEVGTPLHWTLDELRSLPAVELVSVLECAGNGRSFFRPTVLGMPWTYGAVGNARWRGVRLADVLKKAGVKPSATRVLFNGADTPPGSMPDFARTIPLAKAHHPDTQLAFETNGEPLPVSHGFPLRLIAPGWAGDSWVKWITEIRLLDKEYDGFFMKTAYRYPTRPIAPGAAVDAADLKPVEGLRVKSVIAGPIDGAQIEHGPVRVHGAAWAGESPVARVDISTDGGRNWRPATLGRDRARYAWRLWELRWSPPGSGSYVLMARATDAAGATQPLVADWNPSGYLWNASQQVRVQIGPAATAPAQTEQRPVPAFPPKLTQACVSCHEADMIRGQRLSRELWEREIVKMTGWGAQVDPGDRAEILDYLVKFYGPR
jgi:DMSO/TMAO reductase YedYZ molybdopterin-dependent catalytic subunit